MSMFAKLLVAVDGGELTDTITTYALRLAERGEVHFVCAVDPNRFFSDAAAPVFEAETERDAAIKAAQDVIVGCMAKAEKAGVTAHGHVVAEPPVEAILTTADRIEADLIVMASHGRSGFARAVLGSVAERVARQAHVAVLFVPTGLRSDDPSGHQHQIFQGT
jgi:nucleotide-binding universal stress UspA family protein